MSVAAGQPARWTAERLVVASAVLVLGVLCAARWFFRARYLYEWDSAQYALGATDYNVLLHQPHPPGYPIWIVLLKATDLVVGDLNTSQVVLALAFTAAATALFYRLARRLYGAAPAFLAASLLLFAPTVIFYSTVATNYPADMLISVLLGGLAARLWSGDKRVGPWAVFAIALSAGLRQSGALMMAPVLGIALIRAYRLDWRRWAFSTVIGVATVASWYVPTALMNGGIAAFQSFSTATIRDYFAQMSALYGAPAAAHMHMLSNIAIWASVALVVAMGITAILWGAGKLAGRGSPPSRAASSQLGVAFYALWIVPNTLYITLFHCPKPGYLVLTLPPLILLLARIAAPSLRAVGARWRAGAVGVAALAGGVGGMTSTVLAYGHYRDHAVNRTALGSVRGSDADMRATEQLVASGPGAEGTLIIVLASSLFGPNSRSLTVLLPDAQVGALSPDGPEGLLRTYTQRKFHDEYGEAKRISPAIRRILWVHLPKAVIPASVRASFPETRLAIAGQSATVFESDVGDRSIDARVTWEARAYHLVRTGAPTGALCELGRGFVDPWFRGLGLWATGPRSDMIVHLDEPSRVRIVLTLALSPFPAQEVTIHVNGEKLAVVRPEAQNEIIVLRDLNAGDNVVSFEFARWDHPPEELPPPGPRARSVAFGRLTCEVLGEERILFP